jgi:hypothetical protein
VLADDVEGVRVVLGRDDERGDGARHGGDGSPKPTRLGSLGLKKDYKLGITYI